MPRGKLFLIIKSRSAAERNVAIGFWFYWANNNIIILAHDYLGHPHLHYEYQKLSRRAPSELIKSD